MPAPQFVTFTGADDQTSIDGMIELSNLFPIEWGILISATNTSNRFPSQRFIHQLSEFGPQLCLSLHICGRYARDISATGRCDPLNGLMAGFNRTQINGVNLDPVNVGTFSESHGITTILQCRGEQFPESTDNLWLFDRSGGAGIIPEIWPTDNQNRLVGFAGGIGPDNAAAICALLPASQPFWIDMEGKLRDENDRFNLDACRKVCEAVFPDL